MEVPGKWNEKGRPAVLYLANPAVRQGVSAVGQN